MTACKYCQAEIEWTKSGDKSIPMNPDGTRHQCKGGQKPAPAKSQEPARVYHTGTLKTFMQPNIVVTDDKRGDITLYAKEKWALIENIPAGSRVEYSFNNVGNLATLTTTTAPMPSPSFKTGNEVKKEIEQGAKPNPTPAPAPAAAPLSGAPASTTGPNGGASADPAIAQQKTRIWSGETTLTLGSTVNIENFEYLKVEVSGPAADRDQLKVFLDETLAGFGTGATKEMIDKYRKRVIVL